MIAGWEFFFALNRFVTDGAVGPSIKIAGGTCSGSYNKMLAKLAAEAAQAAGAEVTLDLRDPALLL